jgi:cytochrome c2
VQGIAAYLWQTAVQQPVQKQAAGDPVRGKESFETRGCLGCHSVGEGSQRLGGDFAANLTRLGEKATYDYIVRWIHNPRERLLPYCPTERRDITSADYSRKGLPFQFGLDNSRCPNDGAEMLVMNMTVMPSLRLSWEETRDIASYLMTLKQKDPASYPQARFLLDPKLKDRGAFFIRHYGCAGCHEISGFEEEGRIGTELTTEGSKPIERLDFALFHHEAKGKGWFNHKGFFEHKLGKPEIFDEGKEKPRLELLKMPKPNLTKQDITALTTFLLGSVDPTMPVQYLYRPSDLRKDIQEGWWIITKYNCMGCHQLRIGQRSVLMGLPRYQDPDWKEQLPPRLVGVGARVNPAWLLRFLENPALNPADTDRNGARPYLKARMPTFFFSPGELRKLARFFEAYASQQTPYLQPRLEALTEQEMTLARQLFTHPAAPCLKCHATGDPAHDRNATAPNFLLARERLKPGWTSRWMVEPAIISPGTSMPSGLFKREGPRWVFSGPMPEAFRNYPKDHVDLLTRYMFQLTPEEQRRLTGGRASAALRTREINPTLASRLR